MELEGFGASLNGTSIFLCCKEEEAWIPWEFLSGHTHRILVASVQPTLRIVEAENDWTAIFRPHSIKEWSCIATIVRSLPSPVLLVFDFGHPPPPDTFVAFLESTPCTRIWIGSIPGMPDAVFFPERKDDVTEAYTLLTRLGSRKSHGPWKGMRASEWEHLVRTTVESGLGLVLSDIGEREWTLFWHKVSDSNSDDLFSKGKRWLHTGLSILDKLDDSAGT